MVAGTNRMEKITLSELQARAGLITDNLQTETEVKGDNNSMESITLTDRDMTTARAAFNRATLSEIENLNGETADHMIEALVYLHGKEHLNASYADSLRAVGRSSDKGKALIYVHDRHVAGRE